MKPLRLASAVAVLTVLNIGGVVLADWVKVDDMESYTVGSRVEGVGGWTMEPNRTRVGGGWPNSTNAAHFALDPITGGPNKALQLGNIPPSESWPYNVHKGFGVGIADGTAGTMFFCMALSATNDQDWYVGFTTNSVANYNYAVADTTLNGYLWLANNSGGTRCAINGSTPNDTNGKKTKGEWLKFWFLVDNAADTFQIYQQASSDPAPVQLKYGSTTNFAFFHAASHPVIGFAAAAVARFSVKSQGYFDNIYVDNTGVNMTDPTARVVRGTQVLIR